MTTASTTVASGLRGSWPVLAVHIVALVLSVSVHLAVVAPYAAWAWVNIDLDTPGDEGPDDGPVGNSGGEVGEPLAPVQVSVYVERPAPKAKTAAAGPTSTAAVVAPSGAGDAAGGESTEQPADEREIHRGETHKLGVKGRPPRGKKKPCEQIDEIVQTGDTRWRVERDLLDWYATHLRELDKQAGVGSHKGPDGKPDGARLYLPRCSVLKQAGFKNGDVIRTVNGRRAYTIPQAVATYLDVRNDKVVTVELTRKNGDEITHKYRLK